MDEARRLGASKAMVRSRVERGEWVRARRGVYLNAASPHTPDQDLRVGVVACDGVATHVSGTWMWELVDQPPPQPQLSVEAGKGATRLKGLTIHRSRDLHLARVVWLRNIPVTNPLRTIVDVASVISGDRLINVIDTAIASKLVTIEGLKAELERLARRGRPGVAVLRRQLQYQGFTGVPGASVLEAKVWRIIKATGLPLPIVELTVYANGTYRLDFAWPGILLTIEVDGYVWHCLPEQKQHDDVRRNQLQRDGWMVLVYNWRQVCDQPGFIARQISEAYRQRTAVA